MSLSSPLQEVPDDQSIEDVVGRPVTHLSAAKQATGEAIYCDDIPKYAGDFICSSKVKKLSKCLASCLTKFQQILFLMNHRCASALLCNPR